jgi:hypothetical protein
MPEYDVRPGQRRPRKLQATRPDGSPGKVQDPPEWIIDKKELAQVDVAPDGFSGFVAHNGSLGDVTIISRADGDVGLGENVLETTPDVFHMLAELDASGLISTVGDLEPIPPKG